MRIHVHQQFLMLGVFLVFLSVRSWMHGNVRLLHFGSHFSSPQSHTSLYSVLQETGELEDTGREASIDSSALKSESRRVTWSAGAQSSVRVKEINRTVEEYMALPASQYSVLSADQIERLSEREFKCTLGNLNFFGTVICPILFVDVNVIPEKHRSEIIVSRAETTGSQVADRVSFQSLSLNIFQHICCHVYYFHYFVLRSSFCFTLIFVIDLYYTLVEWNIFYLSGKYCNGWF